MMIPRAHPGPSTGDRDGFVMGEGAAVMILEEYERAVARGARIYAEVLGYGVTTMLHHMTAPRPMAHRLRVRCASRSDDAHVSAPEIDYVNAHGSSDSRSTTRLRRSRSRMCLATTLTVFPLSGTKGYYGHALGASGAIEAAICALAMEHEWIPPTVNLTVADEACDLNFLPGSGRHDAGGPYALEFVRIRWHQRIIGPSSR
jgi:3-oxoacyl-[acyl-carrier-protein] synthase II